MMTLSSFAPCNKSLAGASSAIATVRRCQRVACCLLSFCFAMCLGLLALWPEALRAASLPAGFIETDVFGYWPEVAGATFDTTGVMYVWERSGKVWIVENDVKLSTALIDISEEVGAYDDYGLLGFALHPNFRQNGYIYLLYVVDHHHLTRFGSPGYNPNANEYNHATVGRITRYTARASDNFRSVDPASRTILVGETASTGFPILSFTHGVGSLVFGTDGTLLASCGDSAGLSDWGNDPNSYYAQGLSEGIIRPKENVGAFRSQLVDCLNGKVLRLDPLTGDGLPSNPFFDPGNPRAPRSRVWALGLRNPFRMTLQPGTGSHFPTDANPGVLVVGDVGYDTWEEVSVITGPAMNFGWPIFEGFSPPSAYVDEDAANQDAPNPLFGGGCTKQYFSFRDLLKEASPLPPSWPNSCNPAQQIPASIPRFVHARPVIDWRHNNANGPSRAGIFSNNVAAVINIGASGSPITGPQFGGNCAIGGVFYQGTNFPASYLNKYFFSDLDREWVKTMTFDGSDPIAIGNFASSIPAAVSFAVHPINGKMYYVLFYDGVRKISYVGSANQPPTALASANNYYGSAPFTAQFTGNGSIDPEGQALSYSWNFGDGTPLSFAANPSHTFNAAPGVPTKYTVTLTVTDSALQTSTTNLTISVNNTPPSVAITSPAPGTLYPMTGDTLYNLTAAVSDAEHADGQLLYQWQTILYHNNHNHPDPIVTNHITSTLISPIGCDGNLYFYRIRLTVSDPAGLSTLDEVDLYPDCSTNTPPTISSIADQSIDQNTSTGPIGFIIGDAQTAAANLVVSGASSNPVLIPNSNIVFGGSGASRTVTVTPGANQSGIATITVTVGDGSLTTSDTFLIAVSNPANTPPTISNVADQTTSEDIAIGPLGFTVGDAETPVANLLITASSSNPTLLPNSSIVFGGSGVNRTITLTPIPNQSGSATITITVSDGSLIASDTFLLTVTAVNDAPTIANIADQTINQDTTTGSLAFTVGDVEASAGSLTVTGSSSNPALVPNANIAFGGSGANRTVTVTPLAGQSGSSTITVTVSDGALTATDTFLLTINAVTTPTYLLAEGFEGAGFENTGWSKSGSPNENYTNIVLHGAQSLNCVGSQHLQRAFAFSTSFNLYFRVRWNTWTDYHAIIHWDDANYGTAAVLYGDDNRIQLGHGSVYANGSTAIAANTTYHVWVEWTRGTGANGTMKLFISSTGTKPAAPEASITTGNGGATQRIYVGPTGSGPNVIFDRLLVDDVPIGNVTDGNQPPTISDIPNQSINQGTSTTSLPFTVGDAETAAASLTVSGSSGNTTLVPNANIVFGGSGANRTVTVTPAAGQTGTTTIAITVSDGALTTSDTFTLTVNAVNAPPTISDIGNQTINEDGSTSAISFTVGDAETAAGSLSVSGSSSNPSLVPNANIAFAGSGANRTVTVTPLANQSGSATITVTVSDGTLTTNDTFTLTVNAVNDAPTISNIADQVINEDTATSALSFTVGDIETSAASLIVTGSSSNPALVPNANIVFGGNGANRTVTVTPLANQSGTAILTVTVSDGTLATNDTFTLTVNAVNDTPTISDITNQTISQSTSTGPLNFTVGDLETAAASLAVSGTSSNPSLIPNANILFGGSGANRTVTLTPLAGQTGNATITITVSDGALAASDTFTLTVNAVNTAPTISDIGDQTIDEDGNTGALGFAVGDTETAAGSLLITASSSNPALIPNGNIVLGGSAGNRTVTVTPVANQSGTATITVTVSDGALAASDTFLLTVNAVNDAPTVSDIANQTINQDTSAGPLNFTVNDLETAAAILTVNGSSSNPTLVPNANITFGGSGATRTVTVTPATGVTGTAIISVSVNDGALTASDTFTLTVNAVNAPPTISDIANQTISEDGSTGPIGFTVGDAETAAASLLVTASSSNPALVPNANIVLGGGGASRTVTATPLANQSGSATITVTVSDGALTANDTFVVTVSGVNDTPTISNISDQTINEDTATTALSVTVGDIETSAASLTLTGSSSDPALVPNGNIIFGGSGANRTVTVTPLANQSGTAIITVTVSDGLLTATDTFLLTVNVVNDAPTISNISDQTIIQDTNTGAIVFTIGDVETAAASLTVSGSSSNPSLVPLGNIIFGGSGTSRTVIVTPAAGQIGTATITVTVSDGVLTASDTFLLTVNPAGGGPTYLFAEGFEGTGFENTGWTKTGTPNENYTTTVLDGAQSLNCSGAQHIRRTFQYSTSFNLYFRVRWITWSDYVNVVYWDNSSWGTTAALFADNNRFELIHGGASALGTTTLNPNITYHVWVEWARGTGSNGTLKLFVSTTGVKPATPEASITTGSGTATERMYLGPTSAGPNVIFDRILVDDVPIGSNP
jgi:VCBS repeat-containing protein